MAPTIASASRLDTARRRNLTPESVTTTAGRRPRRSQNSRPSRVRMNAGVRQPGTRMPRLGRVTRGRGSTWTPSTALSGTAMLPCRIVSFSGQDRRTTRVSAPTMTRAIDRSLFHLEPSSDGGHEQWYRVVPVADDADVGRCKDKGVGVAVDRQNLARPSHTDHVVELAREPDRHVEQWADAPPGNAHLPGPGLPTLVGDLARRRELRAEDLEEGVEDRVLLGAHTRPDADHGAGSHEL